MNDLKQEFIDKQLNNNELESKVEARTADLKKASEKLITTNKDLTKISEELTAANNDINKSICRQCHPKRYSAPIDLSTMDSGT